MPDKDEFTKGHALLIGVGRYKDELLSVPATAQDAVDISRILSNPNLCAYPNTQVHVLTNKNTTRTGILEKLDILKDQVQEEENSTVIIFFSGHGWLEGEYYFLPYETVTSRSNGKLQVKLDSALSNKDFLDRVRQIQARRLVILLSTCFAGGAGTALSPEIEHSSQLAPVPLGVLDELSQGSGRVIISSSSPKEKSWIKPGATNSIFGTHLLAGLNGQGIKAMDNKIGILDLFTYLSEIVPIDAETLGVSQHPEMKAYSMNRNFPIAMLLGGKALSPSVTATSAIRTREISYNTAIIRTLLKEALSDQELHELCMDHYPAVYDQFSLGMTKPQKISSLIEYCKRHNEFHHLLELIRPINSEKYAEYESRLRNISLHAIDRRGLSPVGDVTLLEHFKQKLDDFIKWLPRLRGGLQLVINSFDQYIMPSDCDTLKTRLTRNCVPVHKFAHFLTQSDDVPLEVIPHRFGLVNALIDFNNQVMAIEKSIIRFCDEYTEPQNPPVKQRREIQIQLQNLLESRKVVIDEAEKLRSIIDR